MSDDFWQKEAARERADRLAASEQRSKDAWTQIGKNESDIARSISGKPVGASSNDKVICTELRRQNLMSEVDYRLCFEDAVQRLTDAHLRGYNFWALAVVRHMRCSNNALAFWRVLAQSRADHIAYLAGRRKQPNRLGAVLMRLGEPMCALIGHGIKYWGSYASAKPKYLVT